MFRLHALWVFFALLSVYTNQGCGGGEEEDAAAPAATTTAPDTTKAVTTATPSTTASAPTTTTTPTTTPAPTIAAVPGCEIAAFNTGCILQITGCDCDAEGTMINTQEICEVHLDPPGVFGCDCSDCVIVTPAPTPADGCADVPGFADPYGYDCAAWGGDWNGDGAPDCGLEDTQGFDPVYYTDAQIAELRTACAKSCLTCPDDGLGYGYGYGMMI